MRCACKVVLALALTAIPAYAVPGWLIGFGVGVTVQVIPFTRNHIIMPPLNAAKRTIQRTLRPIPQDKIDAQRKREEKARRKNAGQKD